MQRQCATMLVLTYDLAKLPAGIPCRSTPPLRICHIVSSWLSARPSCAFRNVSVAKDPEKYPQGTLEREACDGPYQDILVS